MDASDWQHLVLGFVALLVLVVSGTILTLAGQTSNQRLLPNESQPSHGHKSNRSLSSYLNARRSMAGAMRLVELIATVVAASQIVALLDSWTTTDFSWLSIIMIIVVYLIFGRAIPQVLASREMPESRLTRLFDMGRIGVIIAKPVVWLESVIIKAIDKVIPGEAAEEQAIGTEDELQLRLMESDDGVIGDIERQMIDGILSLEEMTVRDIMVPRLDVVALERGVTPGEVIKTIIDKGHSRLPVYQENLDRILGVLYVKDLLPFVIGSTSRLPLLDLIRPAYVIPESKKLPELFTDLKRMRIHMAIVTDEYGGTAGLVTIEDILEEIVGEIQDEYDFEEELIVSTGENTVDADGRLPMEDLEDVLGIEFEEDEDFTTLGGFVHKHLGRLAVTGDTFEAEGVRVEILSVERHRVRKMRVTLLEPVEEPADEEDSESWLQRLRSESEKNKNEDSEADSEKE